MRFLREKNDSKTQTRFRLQQTDNLKNMWFKVMNIKGGERGKRNKLIQNFVNHNNHAFLLLFNVYVNS